MYYFLGLLVLPLALLMGCRWVNSGRKLMAFAAATAVVVYAVTVGSAYVASAWYGHQADEFDINKDGVIILEEQSLAQSDAAERAINDAGRSLTVFFAIPWAFVISGLAAGVLAKRRRRRSKGNSSTVTSSAASQETPSK